MSTTGPHILYSFRRCPYAMRARMALAAAEVSVEHREVLLKDKPAQMLAISPKGTVPVLQLDEGTVLEESIDIMRWALAERDPHGWLQHDVRTQSAMHSQVAGFEANFKTNLDAYKYSARQSPAAADEASDEAGERETQKAVDEKRLAARERCVVVLAELEQQLSASGFLYGSTASFADVALFPFVRQFANVEAQWFNGLPYGCVQTWLSGWLGSEMFAGIMQKHPQWRDPEESCG